MFFEMCGTILSQNICFDDKMRNVRGLICFVKYLKVSKLDTWKPWERFLYQLKIVVR